MDHATEISLFLHRVTYCTHVDLCRLGKLSSDGFTKCKNLFLLQSRANLEILRTSVV